MQDILLVKSVASNGKLDLQETNLDEFRNQVDSGKIGVVKSVFLEQKLIQFRKDILQWSEEEPENNPEIDDPDLYKKTIIEEILILLKQKQKESFMNLI